MFDKLFEKCLNKLNVDSMKEKKDGCCYPQWKRCMLFVENKI